MQDRLRDADALQHAFGKLAQLHPGRVRQTGPRQHRLDPPPCFAGGDRREPRIIVQEFGGRQIIVEIGLLGQKADLRLHCRVVDFLAQNLRPAAAREHQAHQQL